ncbi:hypothetical protein PAPYR_11269 [Paratrimastix pyriformis]|uniref:Uncharacterized protein n=1 Tax=Paratrimastix pyriformis TaxID=342808 RepID=A0ABQ8U8D1_9EUKA|nr:hypothetical protein PAPYR_11269 [Paratrimastix pyriformis]
MQSSLLEVLDILKPDSSWQSQLTYHMSWRQHQRYYLLNRYMSELSQTDAYFLALLYVSFSDLQYSH